ncbi:MAG: serine/threonine protein kinase, partial [Myxococcota bacterium]
MVAQSARYRELSPLAEGGMATLALALRDDGKEVVIKRVRPPFDRDPVFARMFHDEGRLCAALDGELFPALLDQGTDEHGPYLVFELVEGTDLAHVLEACCERGEGLELPVFFGVALPLLRAVARAHALVDDKGTSLRVIHRDISPGNVLLSVDGDVKLADFGVATSTLKTEHTSVGELKGKYAYMAPEQTRGEPLDGRADLFAVGVVLWECLAGRRLFDAPTDADVVQAVRHAEVPDITGQRSDMPVELTTLLDHLLAKDATARPLSADQALRELEGLAAALGLDRGGRSHVARCARAHPRREASLRASDGRERRRTQRVVNGAGPDGLNELHPPAPPAERSVRKRSARAVVAAALLITVAGLGLAMATASFFGDDDDQRSSTAMNSSDRRAGPVPSSPPKTSDVGDSGSSAMALKLAAPVPAVSAPAVSVTASTVGDASTPARGRPRDQNDRAASIEK